MPNKDELIHVLACSKAGDVGSDDDKRTLYRCPCLIGNRTIDMYTTNEIKPGFYNIKPAIKFIKTVDENGNVKNKPTVIARIGSFYSEE